MTSQLSKARPHSSKEFYQITNSFRACCSEISCPTRGPGARADVVIDTLAKPEIPGIDEVAVCANVNDVSLCANMDDEVVMSANIFDVDVIINGKNEAIEEWCFQADEVVMPKVSSQFSHSSATTNTTIVQAPSCEDHKVPIRTDSSVYAISSDRRDSSDRSVVAIFGRGTGSDQEMYSTFSAKNSIMMMRNERTLTSELDAEIMKGVPLDICLEGFGRNWTGHISGGLGTSDDPYGKACVVDSIDDFISHDWGTKGWRKFITLSILYNGLPATYSAIIASLIFGFLQIYVPQLRLIDSLHIKVAGVQYQADSAGYFGLLSGELTFLFVLFFWQRIKACIWCRQRMVFMDKLCIDQADPELKARGILGLSGFLKKSDRLVVLWSPRYFTRLWCVYELASWMAKNRPLTKIEIAPVAQGVIIGLMVLCITLLVTLMAWITPFDTETYRVAFCSVSFLGMFLPLHVMRHLVRDLRLLTAQIRGFSFQDAECYCCSVDHLDLCTSKTIPCDKKLINNQLFNWFEDKLSEQISDSDPDSAVDLFNDYVRYNFGKHILQRVGGSRVKYKLAVVASVPLFFFVADRLYLLFVVVDAVAAWRLLLHYLGFLLAFCPLSFRCALKTALIMDRCFGAPKYVCVDILVTCLATLIVAAGGLGLMLGLQITLEKPEWAPQVILWTAVIIVTMVMYRGEALQYCNNHHPRRRRQTRMSSSEQLRRNSLVLEY